jgi:putative membrane protein
MSLADLPTANACCNALSAVLLTAGWVCIRRGRRAAHRRCMLGALAASALFLGGYLTYHFLVRRVTVFRDPAWFRPIYLGLLASHTLLAAVSAPLVLLTLTRALRGHFDAHRRLARWTWPVWLYVSGSGVLIYALLYHLFPQPGT